VSIRESRLCDELGPVGPCPNPGKTCPTCGLDKCSYHFGYGRVEGQLKFFEASDGEETAGDLLILLLCRACMVPLRLEALNLNQNALHPLEDDIIKVLRAHLAAKSLEPKDPPK
jgi:hypothetical protein